MVRVRTLSTYAYAKLPSKHVRKEVISKFCQGAIDKEAGKYTLLKHPKSIDEAEQVFKEYQCFSTACDGKKGRSR